MNQEIRINIRTDRDIMPAVMRAGEYCRDAGFDEAGWRMVSTVVSELAHNIIKYADHGCIRLRRVRSRTRRGVEVVAEDSGPGIADVKRALKDGYSSSGTLGLGLPGVRRMVDEFELDSTPGEGTRLLVRKWV